MGVLDRTVDAVKFGATQHRFARGAAATNRIMMRVAAAIT